jgi:hypothetical protein
MDWVVFKPPNQWLIRRKSESEVAISAGEPESLSRSSGITLRFIVECSVDYFSSPGEGLSLEIDNWHLLIGTSLLNFRQFFFQQLLVVQIGVIAVSGQQFIMRAKFYDAAAVQHGNHIGVAHGGNAM